MKILKESNKDIVITIEQKIKKKKFSWKWPSNIKRRRFKSQRYNTVMKSVGHIIYM